MPHERASALLPDKHDIEILFEISRLLGRHAQLAHAIGPLLEMLHNTSSLKNGIALFPEHHVGLGEMYCALSVPTIMQDAVAAFLRKGSGSMHEAESAISRESLNAASIDGRSENTPLSGNAHAASKAHISRGNSSRKGADSSRNGQAEGSPDSRESAREGGDVHAGRGDGLGRKAQIAERVHAAGSTHVSEIAHAMNMAHAAGATSSLVKVISMALESSQMACEAECLAVPVLIKDKVAAIFAFALAQGDAGDSARIAQGLAVLLAEALVLRRVLRVEAVSGMSVSSGLPSIAGVPRAETEWAPPEMVGRSASMRALYSLMHSVAATDATVLIMGESGTGKELVARALHAHSSRSTSALITVNCAALPETVIESELFGHEKGAFTGALEQRKGLFELAHNGTLFLDEITELKLPIQAKLLRVLQEGEYQRVGSSKTLKTNARIVAASNIDIEKEVSEGRFRPDLFWRLNVFPLKVPPLRERQSDIMLLADYFCEKHGKRLGKSIVRISSPAIDLFMSYNWPGNVRELENCIERAVILSKDSVVHAYHLPPSLQSAESTGTGPHSTLDSSLARLEKELLFEAMKLNHGNAAAAARSLGISERRIGLALRRFGIDRKKIHTQR